MRATYRMNMEITRGLQPKKYLLFEDFHARGIPRSLERIRVINLRDKVANRNQVIFFHIVREKLFDQVVQNMADANSFFNRLL